MSKKGRPTKDPSGMTGYEIQQNQKTDDKIRDAKIKESKRRKNIDHLSEEFWCTNVSKNPRFVSCAVSERESVLVVPYSFERSKASAGGYYSYFFDANLVNKIVTHANHSSSHRYKFTAWEFYSFMALRMWFHVNGCTKLTRNTKVPVITDNEDDSGDDTSDDAGDGIESSEEDYAGDDDDVRTLDLWNAARAALGPLALNRRRFHQYHSHCLTSTAIIHMEYSARFAKFVIPAGVVVCDEKKVKVKISSRNVIMKGPDPCLWTTEWVVPLRDSLCGYCFALEPWTDGHKLDRVDLWKTMTRLYDSETVKSFLLVMDSYYLNHDALKVLAGSHLKFVATCNPAWWERLENLLQPIVKNDGDTAAIRNENMAVIAAVTQCDTNPSGKKKPLVITNVMDFVDNDRADRKKKSTTSPGLVYRALYHYADFMNWWMHHFAPPYKRRAGDIGVFDNTATMVLYLNCWSWCLSQHADTAADIATRRNLLHDGIVKFNSPASTKQASSNNDPSLSSSAMHRPAKRKKVRQSKSVEEESSEADKPADDTGMAPWLFTEFDFETKKASFLQSLEAGSYALMLQAYHTYSLAPYTITRRCSCYNCEKQARDKDGAVRMLFNVPDSIAEYQALALEYKKKCESLTHENDDLNKKWAANVFSLEANVKLLEAEMSKMRHQQNELEQRLASATRANSDLQHQLAGNRNSRHKTDDPQIHPKKTTNFYIFSIFTLRH